MAGYPGMARVGDADTRKVVKTLFDLIQQLQTRVQALEAAALQRSGVVDAGGQRVSNVGDATGGTDAVNLNQVRRLIDTVKQASY